MKCVSVCCILYLLADLNTFGLLQFTFVNQIMVVVCPLVGSFSCSQQGGASKSLHGVKSKSETALCTVNCKLIR